MQPLKNAKNNRRSYTFRIFAVELISLNKGNRLC